MSFVTLVSAILTIPLALLTFCFAIEVLAGLKPLLPPRLLERETDAVIVVPAHDEEAVLPTTLGPLKDAAGNLRILVVADNCTDRTAAIAREFGVEVIERFDDTLRGKGFALDFAREHLTADPPNVVAIIDADCTTDAQSISILVSACAAEQAPCQATNLQKPAPDASVAVQLSTFAFFIKNVIRERALQRLAGRVHLLGTGMAFPWAIFSAAELATAHIVEDVKLGIELSAAGHFPKLVEGAAVWSNAETETNTLSQRERWEGGFIANALSVGPTMFVRAFRSLDFKMLWAAIDMMVPPVALLLLVDCLALFFVAVLTLLLRLRYWPLLVLVIPMAAAALGLGLAWRAGGRRFISLGSLLRAPLYVAWKVPMYFGFAKRGTPKDWQRTGR